MKTAIIYASTHGTTRKAAEILKDNLKGDVEFINLKKNSNPDFSSFDYVILGSSIHAGRPQGRMKKFIKSNMDKLRSQKTGLYLCCMAEGDEAWKEFGVAYPKELSDTAIAKSLFGGEFLFEKMNFLQRKIIEKIAGTNESVSKINNEAIKEFAKKINSNK